MMHSLLLELLAEESGFRSVGEMLADYSTDSVAPAICPECHYIEEMEKDQREGYCPECNTNSMKSAFVLAGVI
jgi:predicted Zn-ribbon and HTH transcriptional regulator